MADFRRGPERCILRAFRRGPRLSDSNATLSVPLSANCSSSGLYQQAILYRLLFDVAAETLMTIATDPKHLGAQIGATLVLHTWVFGTDPPPRPQPRAQRRGFFLPVRVLSCLFSGRSLEELEFLLHRLLHRQCREHSIVP